MRASPTSGIVLAAATLLACGRGAPGPGPQAPPPNAPARAPAPVAPAPGVTGQVVVDVVGCHDDRGQLLAALYASADGFPGDRAKAFAHVVAPVHAGRATAVFDRVPAGPFAVVVHHDEDSDFKLATGLFGIPTEGYGFSRDAHGSFGAPSFDDSRLTLGADERKNIVIHVRY